MTVHEPVALCHADADADMMARELIVGGTVATTAFSFVASIQDTTSLVPLHLCGGALIDAQHVLTTITCIKKRSPATLRVVLGSTTLSTAAAGAVFTYVIRIHCGRAVGGECEFPVRLLRAQYCIQADCAAWWCRWRDARSVKAVLANPLYSNVTNSNDLAVLRLHARVNTALYVPVARNTVSANEAAGTLGTALGYGATTPNAAPLGSLKQASLSLLTLQSCNNAQLGVSVGSDALCAAASNVGLCSGDGGAPLIRVVNGVTLLLGVFSFPTRCTTGVPAVFAKVSTTAAASFIAGALSIPANDDFRNAMPLDCSFVEVSLRLLPHPLLP